MFTYNNFAEVTYKLLVSIVASCLLLAGFFFSTLQAKATPGMAPFGGPLILSVAVPIPNPLAAFAPCPAHFVILDYTGTVPKPIGISTLYSTNATPGSIFDWGNLFTPGVQTLGEFIPLPIPTCAGLPYPVFQSFFNLEYGKFQIGTGAIPGI